MRVVGLMSGTSFDAIDAAAVDLDLVGDELRLTSLGMVSVPYEDDLRHDLARLLPPHSTDIGAVCRIDNQIGQAFASVAARAVAELCGGDADLVCSHGQTVYHWVQDGRARGTLQLGQPAWIAHATGVPVVSDLRPADIAAGGQGAPLVPEFDRLLLAGRTTVDHRPAALNLGGIANVTTLGRDGSVRAWDTGPANALIDAAVAGLTGGREDHDRDGLRGARGAVDIPALQRLLAEPYYTAAPPKSTGKELFHTGYVGATLDAVPDGDDLVATLTALTAQTVADAVRAHAPDTDELWVSGGGLRNPTLMRMLAAELPSVRVASIAGLGIDPAAKEAIAFAVLGFLTVHGIPGAVPTATGAARAAVLGRITPIAGRRPAPPATTRPTRLLVRAR